MASDTRIGVFGWGIVAPRSPNVDAFHRNLEAGGSWLEPFDGFGPDNFLVGRPEFDLGVYGDWLHARFPPNRLRQIEDKMGQPAHYAIGAFIQALGQNQGLEGLLSELGERCHVYLGTGIGDLPTTARVSLDLERAQYRWDRFWSQPERNAELRRYLDDPESWEETPGPPMAPQEASGEDRFWIEKEWFGFWAARSDGLREYLEEQRQIEAVDLRGTDDADKRNIIRRKRSANGRLLAKWGAPEPPWEGVSANLIWNIHNTPASQVSMLGKIHGPSFAPVAACSTFGVCLKMGMDAIRRGDAKVVVVGATDPPPHPLVVGAFYKARVISADRCVSQPLTALRGTHIAGGAALWIIGDYEELSARGMQPLGLEPVAVGLSSDADHIITPSEDGPRIAIRSAISGSGVTSAEIDTWDLHATATPGDHQEVENLRRELGEEVLVTARKGTFGHGMGASGGWELTAQYLGLAAGRLLPTPLARDELHPEIEAMHRNFVFDRACDISGRVAGKLSMGVGGINACVISRRWPSVADAGER